MLHDFTRDVPGPSRDIRGVNIEIATEGDAAELAAFAERTFRDTYAAENTQADIDAYVRGHFAPELQRAEITDPSQRVVVVRQDGAMVGYAHLREAGIPAPVIGRAVEISRFYVAPEVKGKGVAHELMPAALDEARRMGAELVWLGVWERNPRAIAFYRRHEFAEVGMQTFTMGSDVQHDLVMARRL